MNSHDMLFQVAFQCSSKGALGTCEGLLSCVYPKVSSKVLGQKEPFATHLAGVASAMRILGVPTYQ